MKNDEFHIPFIKSLVFIASTTILLMLIVPIFIYSWTSLAYKNATYTTISSQESLESGK